MTNYLSGEFILDRYPNGGLAVLLRTLWITFILYFIAIAIRSRVAPYATWEPSITVARQLISSTIPWFGAIFAGVYAALYARFASQWSYLANLYNQIMCAQVQCDASGTTSGEAMALWQAGFIEDAEALHLARKPMFASVIVSMLGKDAVRNAYKQYTPGGSARLDALEASVKAVVSKAAQQFVDASGDGAPNMSSKRTREKPRAA
ncbi:hypothetical protein [Rhodanobacter glycinis]|uniref:Uncharacterized protein n=1 Tax=Rhodanobacter glycinis TaxID=582702 RepID=A0A1I4GK42_9GAMM|nr:hypothetical protein [Rhodanobacter glycinis]SFL29496.1 hypothetical protein SAMN05192579_1266 [Rhodanobacter glycinis]